MLAAMRANHIVTMARGVDAAAALCLGAAVGLAVTKLAPATPLTAAQLAVAAIGAGTTIALLGFAALARVESGLAAPWRFDPVIWEPALALDELLLDQPVEDSRVVRLFGAQPLAVPGELVTRIADYLDGGRAIARPPAESGPVPGDASAALHAALADIRRSLR